MFQRVVLAAEVFLLLSYRPFAMHIPSRANNAADLPSREQARDFPGNLIDILQHPPICTLHINEIFRCDNRGYYATVDVLNSHGQSLAHSGEPQEEPGVSLPLYIQRPGLDAGLLISQDPVENLLSFKYGPSTLWTTQSMASGPTDPQCEIDNDLWTWPSPPLESCSGLPRPPVRFLSRQGLCRVSDGSDATQASSLPPSLPLFFPPYLLCFVHVFVRANKYLPLA